jgi:hypothetical protein
MRIVAALALFLLSGMTVHAADKPRVERKAPMRLAMGGMMGVGTLMQSPIPPAPPPPSASLLLAEDGRFLTTESGSHLEVEH